MSDDPVEDLEFRVLVLAPTPRDAATTRNVLTDAGMSCHVCQAIADVRREAERGAGAAFVTAEAVAGDTNGVLADWIRSQPPWSDLPLIVLTPSGEDSPRLLSALEAAGPMTLIKRPVQLSSLVSAVRSALRDRRRQYSVRDLMAERLRAAEVLAAERERYRVTLSSIGDAVIATDTEGRVTFLNAVAEELTRWSGEAARGRPLEEVFRIVNESTRQTVANPVEKALREGVVVGLANHTILIARDGTERPLDDSAAPIRSPGGETVGAVLVFRDITERKQAETELRVREERYRVLVTATSDVVYLMSPDWSELQPLDGRDLVASNSEPIRGWMEKNLPAFEHARVRAVIEKSVANKQTFEMEHQVIRGDGTLGWAFSRAAPILDEGGRIVEWFGTARDVTDHKKAEQELARVTAESERRRRLYETVLSGTPDFVYVFSLDHRVLYANDSLLRMWGRDASETFGKTFLEIGYEPWHAAMHDREIDQVRETKKPIRGEVPFDGTHGRRIYDYIFVPVLGEDGEVEAVAGTTRDVTDRKRLEDALRETDRKKDDFIALLAHELRNPLAPIRNGLQVIRLSQDRAARDRSQQMMDRQLAHMVRMIDDLLDVSRIGRSKMELRRARVSLADVVNSAAEAAGPAIDEAGHALSVSLPPERVFLDADLTRLAQVFSNLLTNSAKYTTRGGSIWLSARAGGGRVTVAVRDTGIGIPAASLTTIFDMFSQVDRPVERSAGGLGIGLSLVKGLVEMHGGTVTAQSDGEGKGSTFVVDLPVLAVEPEPASDTPADSGRTGMNSGRRILVVDDNRDGAESLAMMLGLLGNEIATAHDGIEAVESAGHFRPEVILMDVGMPRLNGLEATKRIRGQPWGKGMTIIALTGWGQEADRARSREAGCDGHLVKPVDLPDLEKLLRKLSEEGG
ncbi:hybrid sensor histidine kinase/response regulator [Zavarzinella formosa]|uniref:hybrid sensor histidine kinase/response regulator n=1 Tax=Zavarzinella formosa TaxID=360055 RepID=UPI00031DA465|nr:PAS domain-containing hybrid sensor histidine kinase/response regulator [Zavarzinella formosa]